MMNVRLLGPLSRGPWTGNLNSDCLSPLAQEVVHDSPYFKIINFNFKPGQELPVHSHDIEGQVSLVILEGSGEFLGKDGSSFPGKQGEVVISDIAEPHGFRATTNVRLMVTIAPPI